MVLSIYYLKKEVILQKKEAAKLEKNLGGIKEMRRLPSAIRCRS